MADPKQSTRYTGMSRDDLLTLLDSLLDERDIYSAQVRTLTIEATAQRVEGWDSGYRWGWRDCIRHARLTQKNPASGDTGGDA